MANNNCRSRLAKGSVGVNRRQAGVKPAIPRARKTSAIIIAVAANPARGKGVAVMPTSAMGHSVASPRHKATAKAAKTPGISSTPRKPTTACAQLFPSLPGQMPPMPQ